MNRDARVFVAGGSTLIGSALVRLLTDRGFTNLVGVSEAEPKLTEYAEVEAFFATCRPEYVILAGGLSGGIALNRAQPADLILDNLLTATTVVPAAYRHGVEKLLYLASSCAYPKAAEQPLHIRSLLTGPLEPTSEAYATAKLAGWRLCDAYRKQYGCRFITGFPANAFGPGDDFSMESGHVIPALIRRTHEARVSASPAMTVWGTGTPRREFIYSRDLADACLFVLDNYDGIEPINLGGGTDLTIAEAAHTIAEVVGYTGRLEFDFSRPDGAPRKGLDSSELLSMGWRACSEFRTAVAETYNWFLQHEIEEDCCYARAAV